MTWKQNIETLTACLFLERDIVGVKIASGESIFSNFDAREPRAPIPFCVAVKCASEGHSLKFTKECSKCMGSTRALGLTEPAEDYFLGLTGCDLGLYRDRELASEVAQRMRNLPPQAYGVIVKPALEFETEPGVSLIIGSPESAMRIIQGYSYHFGMNEHLVMTGNQALCVEVTSTPLSTGSVNASLLCSGTRHAARWGTGEMAVGIPKACLELAVDGVRKTVNFVEPDKHKDAICAKLGNIGLSHADIIRGQAYYLNSQKQSTRASSSGLTESAFAKEGERHGH